MTLLAHLPPPEATLLSWPALLAAAPVAGAVTLAGSPWAVSRADTLLRRLSVRVQPPEPRPVAWSAAAAWVTRAGLGLLILVGLLGGATQHTNPLTALVIGVGLPLVVVSAAVGNGWWDRADPLRVRERRAAVETGPATLIAVWVVGLALYLEPQTWYPTPLALLLAGYAAVWLLVDLLVPAGTERPAEPWARLLHLLRVPYGGSWDAALLCSVVGLAVAGTARASGTLPYGADLGRTLPAIGVASGTALLLWRSTRSLRSPVATLVPMAVGTVVAAALVENRLSTSAQLLVTLTSDPLTRGWDLLGTANLPIVPEVPPRPLAGAVQMVALALAGAVAQARGAIDHPPARVAVAVVAAAAAYVGWPR